MSALPGFMFRLLTIIMSGSLEERGQLPASLLQRESINGPCLTNMLRLHADILFAVVGVDVNLINTLLQILPVASCEGTQS